MWPSDRRIVDRLGIQLPIIQAPMAGASSAEMAIAVCEAGGLGSLACAMLEPATVRAELGVIRQRTAKPVNLNFFTHKPARDDPTREAAWKARLSVYYSEFGLDADTAASAINRAPFDDVMCEVVEELKPEVVSFHFGLPSDALLSRVKASGSLVMSSATTVAEAHWLEDRGCDVIIAQGYEAGGHRGMFLTEDLTSQVGTMALVPQVVDAVNVPVVAAGGIGDGRGVAAAIALGAAAVQIGTAYLFTPESVISDIHRVALSSDDHQITALTNLFTGRPARSLMNRLMRELGPMSDLAPAFPTAGGAIARLKAQAEARGSGDFSLQNTGQAAGFGRVLGAGELTLMLADDARRILATLGAPKRSDQQ